MIKSAATHGLRFRWEASHGSLMMTSTTIETCVSTMWTKTAIRRSETEVCPEDKVSPWASVSCSKDRTTKRLA